jgi:hypothetical protein
MVVLLGYREAELVHWLGIVEQTNLVAGQKLDILRQPRGTRITIFEGFMAVVRSKSTSPTWNDVKTALRGFDRAGLQGLVQDLYTASKDNQAFLHARLGLGHDQLQPFKASISRWISPDLAKGQQISVSKAKKAIADYKKAVGHPDGVAELSIFYCEEAFGFLESCSLNDEGYFVALIGWVVEEEFNSLWYDTVDELGD